MSIKAYRVKEIITKNSDSFNLYYDEALVDFLQGGGWLGQLNIDGCGLIDISVEALQEALVLEGLSSATAEALKQDIEFSDNGWVRYYCY